MRYEKYIETRLPWLQEIPMHWKFERAKTVINNAKVLNKNKIESNVLSLTLNGVIRNDPDNPIGLSPTDYSTYQLFEKDNLVFKLIDLENISTSRVGLVPENGIMSSAYIRGIVNKSLLLPKYAFYWYFKLYNEEVFNKLGSGVRQTINASQLLNMEIPIPPLEEQKQIADFLDWKIGQIDQLIEINKKKILVLEKLKRRMLVEIIHKGLNVDDSRSILIPELGKIPSEWKILPLFSICYENKEKNTGLKNKNLLSLSYGNIINKDINTVGGLLPESFEGYQIVSEGMTVLRLTDLQNDKKSLRTGLVKDKGIITSAYLALKPENNINAEYFQLVLHVYDLLKVFYRLGTGLRQSISFKELRRLPIPCPELEEQHRIVKMSQKYVNDFNERIDSSKKKIEQFQKLRESLISEIVAGKKDIRSIEIPERKEDK